MDGTLEKQRKHILQGDVVKIFRDRGFEDDISMELLNRWLDQEQERVAQENTSKAGLMLNIVQAEICRDSELYDLAIDAYFDAALQAKQEIRSDEDRLLYEGLVHEWNKLLELLPLRHKKMR